MTDPDVRRRPVGGPATGPIRLTTRELLICAVLGAVTALAAMALSQPLAFTAAASPPLYALLGGYSALAPLLALRLTGKAGAASVTALCASIVAWPFSTLGLLLLIAYLGPALAMDLLFLLLRRHAQRVGFWAAVAAGALTIFGLSIPIISPEQLNGMTIALTFVFRLVSYGLAGAVALHLHRALTRIGVRVSHGEAGHQRGWTASRNRRS